MRLTDVVVWRSASQKRRYARGLARVEALLEAVVDDCPGVLGAACAATLTAGGKRVRPLLVLLSARRDRPLREPLHRAAAAVELLHMATLVHDDVLDAAVLRRGRPTIAHEMGVPLAISTGNYLFAQAFAELVRAGDGRAVDLLSQVALGLSQGEVLQMAEAFRTDLTAEQYVHRCELKTADLFAAACHLGALAGGADERDTGELAAFGRALGLAFQIFDDILDLTGEEGRTGKRVGADLRDGTVTLPVILALEARPDLGPRLQRPLVEEADMHETIAQIVATGGIDRARGAALGQIHAARRHLERCSDTIERELLSEAAGWVVERFN